jgi:ribonuclease P protein component
MLPYKNRLIKRKDFEIVHRKGIFYSSGNIFLKIRENNIQETRIGVVIGLKFSKKATERNQVKRVLREYFRNRIREIKRGYDIIIMARKDAKERPRDVDWPNALKSALIKGNLVGSVDDRSLEQKKASKN